MKRTAVKLGISAMTLATGLLMYSTIHASHHEEVEVGSKVPEFSIKDENGVEHRLSQYEGKVVVLEWTNPDCPYVARHYDAGTMEKLANQLGADGVVWFAVNSTHDNKPEDTRAWKEGQGFDHATLQDPEGALGHLLGARTTPHMFVIDGEGILRYEGAIDDDPRGRSDSPTNYVSGGVQALLAGNAPDPSQTKAYGCSVKYASN